MNNQGTKYNPIESFAPRLCAFYSGKMFLFPVFNQICTITMNDIITQLINKPIVDILSIYSMSQLNFNFRNLQLTYN